MATRSYLLTKFAKRSPEHRDAVCEALRSCIDHMNLHWTDDPLERKAGHEVAAALGDLYYRATSLRLGASR